MKELPHESVIFAAIYWDIGRNYYYNVSFDPKQVWVDAWGIARTYPKVKRKWFLKNFGNSGTMHEVLPGQDREELTSWLVAPTSVGLGIYDNDRHGANPYQARLERLRAQDREAEKNG
jgi:hypothetical protein